MGIKDDPPTAETIEIQKNPLVETLRLAHELALELQDKCGAPIHDEQVRQLRDELDSLGVKP